MKITKVFGRAILDSRGYPTVEADVWLTDGSMGRAAVPSGASRGSHEAWELRDGDKAYGGKGVDKAVEHINGKITDALIGQPAWDQVALDKLLCKLDGTDNKANLGANAILAVSLATAKAMAVHEQKPLYAYIAQMVGNEHPALPMPMMNILNGGQHAASSTDIQEFMIIPVGAHDFPHALQMGSEVFHALGKLLAAKGYATTVGDEGGYAPQLAGGTKEALDLVIEAIIASGYKPGADVALGLDVAASELVKNSHYEFAREHQTYTSQQLIERYEQLAIQYPIISIEDGLGEDDWQHWSLLTRQLGGELQIVGDDLLVTNTHLLKRAIDEKSANAILIKPNQIGTLTETIQAVQMAQAAGWRTIISHRSGETEDTTIAHLAVGLSAGQIKTGSLSRTERLAKYNELLRIAETLDKQELKNPF